MESAPTANGARSTSSPSSSRDAVGGSAYLNGIAGGVAGMFVRAALFPVDTIKTHMQTNGQPLTATLRSLLLDPGRFYRGLTPALFEIGFNRGALMSLSTHATRLMPADVPEGVRDALAGGAAGALKTAVVHPLDTLTCRGQLGRTQWELLVPYPHAALYNGIGPAVLRSAGGMSIWLSVR